MDAFVMAFNQVLEKKEPYIKHLKELFIKLADTQDLEKQQDLARTKHADLINDLRRYMNENTRQIQDQEEYNRRFSEMDARCKRAEERIAYLDGKMVEQLGQKEQIHRCLKKLEQCGESLAEFDAYGYDAGSGDRDGSCCAHRRRRWHSATDMRLQGFRILRLMERRFP